MFRSACRPRYSPLVAELKISGALSHIFDQLWMTDKLPVTRLALHPPVTHISPTFHHRKCTPFVHQPFPRDFHPFHIP